MKSGLFCMTGSKLQRLPPALLCIGCFEGRDLEPTQYSGAPLLRQVAC
jgi:hypothetical protein